MTTDTESAPAQESAGSHFKPRLPSTAVHDDDARASAVTPKTWVVSFVGLLPHGTEVAYLLFILS